MTAFYYKCGSCHFATKLDSRADKHERENHGHKTERVIAGENGSGLISAETFILALRERLPETRGGRTIMAVELGISPQFLSKVLAGRAFPGPTIAKALGYEQVIAFRELPARKRRT